MKQTKNKRSKTSNKSTESVGGYENIYYVNLVYRHISYTVMNYEEADKRGCVYKLSLVFYELLV